MNYTYRIMAVHKVFFATHNQTKLHNMRNMLGPSFDVIGLNIKLPEIQGEIEDIVKHKCKVLYEKYIKLGITEPIIVENIALCINALNGLPGPYIKWFSNKLGNAKLFELIEQYDDHRAQAICTYCFMDKDKQIIIDGVVNGQIVKPLNNNDFGWDSIFKPDGYNQTFAEIDNKEKYKVSPRFIATDKLRNYLVNRR